MKPGMSGCEPVEMMMWDVTQRERDVLGK